MRSPDAMQSTHARCLCTTEDQPYTLVVSQTVHSTNGSEQHRETGPERRTTRHEKRRHTPATRRARPTAPRSSPSAHGRQSPRNEKSRSPPKIRPDAFGRKRWMKKIPSMPKAKSPYCRNTSYFGKLNSALVKLVGTSLP